MSNELEEVGTTEQTVEVLLRKFDGEVEDGTGVLAEEIYLVDGEMQWQKFYEDGVLVKTIEGGNDATN